MTVTERPTSPVVTFDEVHRISMEEYEEMVRRGALMGMRVELIDVHRDPGPDGYRTVTIDTPEQSLAPLLLPDRPMSFGELLDQV